MRKRYKSKLRSCSLCKPHKLGWDRRWKARDLHDIERAEIEMSAARRSASDTRSAAGG
jgi:hypothetical protein